MTGISWAAAGVALLCVQTPGTAQSRIRALAGHGRLAAASSRAPHPPRPFRTGLPARRLLFAGWALGEVASLATGGPAIAVAAAALTATVLRLASVTARRRGMVRQDDEMLAAVRMIICELDAGSRPVAALTAAASGASSLATPLLDAAALQSDSGADAARMLCTHPVLAPLGYAWGMASATGAPLGRVLGQVADDVAARCAVRREVAAVLAGPGASAMLLGGLPLVGLGLGSAMGAAPLATLFGTPAGRVLLCVGIALDCVGMLWVSSVLVRAEPP